MLLQFSVENYRSYKNKAVLSLEASTDKELPNNVVYFEKNGVLKVASIFGANASGKSNLFRALTAAIINVRNSNTFQIGQPLFDIIPFRFDEESKVEPSAFEFVFYQGGVKYVYMFSATSQEVKKECLYYYKTSKPSTIFERENADEDVYKFTDPSIKRELEPIAKKNTKNKLFLSTATQWNSIYTKTPFEFFANNINTYSPDFNIMLPQIGEMLMNDNDQSVRDFVIKLLKAGDIQIESYSVEKDEQSGEEIYNAFPPELKNLISRDFFRNSKNVNYLINTFHEVNGRKYSLKMDDESDGTRNIFGISPILKRAFQVTGETVCIDEFDRSLHPNLVQFLVDLFNDESVNACNAQLIISSHSALLLSQDHLRRDQFYFVEKDNETGNSDLYSLDEFSPRKRENIRNAYLLGRYGAVPNLDGGASLK